MAAPTARRGRIDHGHAEAGFQPRALARHAGAAHDDDVGAVLVDQLAADRGHASLRFSVVGQLGDAEADGEVGGDARLDAERAQVAPVPGHAGGQDGDDADGAAERQRRQQTALGDAEGRLASYLAHGVQTGVGEAGDHEGSGTVVLLLDQAAEGGDHLVDVALGLYAGRSLGQGEAFDLRAAGVPQRLDRRVDRAGHALAAVGIDDDDAFGHGGLAPPVFPGFWGWRKSGAGGLRKNVSRETSRRGVWRAAPEKMVSRETSGCFTGIARAPKTRKVQNNPMH